MIVVLLTWSRWPYALLFQQEGFIRGQKAYNGKIAVTLWNCCDAAKGSDYTSSWWAIILPELGMLAGSC